MINHIKAATLLKSNKEAIALRASASYGKNTLPINPENKLDAFLHDFQIHLLFLAEAILCEYPQIFGYYIKWLTNAYYFRSVPLDNIREDLHKIEYESCLLLNKENQLLLKEYIKFGVQNVFSEVKIGTFFKEGKTLNEEAIEYLRLLLSNKRTEAHQLILELVKQYHVKNIYEYVFQTTQRELGLLWETNQIQYIQEHYCTAATQQIIASLFPYMFNSRKTGKKLISCSVSQEQHQLGIRMVTDFFENEGWDTCYLGSNVSADTVISSLMDFDADVLALSVTMSYYINDTRELIDKVKQSLNFPDLKIIVGGYPFNLIPELWKYTGADGMAASASEAVSLANQLLKDGR